MSSISRFDGPIWEDQRQMFIPENMDKPGAERLAKKIERFWRKHGKDVKTRVVTEVSVAGAGHLYCVRSDLRNGLPR
jgi:hypothetical protein